MRRRKTRKRKFSLRPLTLFLAATKGVLDTLVSLIDAIKHILRP